MAAHELRTDADPTNWKVARPTDEGVREDTHIYNTFKCLLISSGKNEKKTLERKF